MDFYEQEMRQMFENTGSVKDKVFVGKTMLAKLDNDKLLKLEFTNSRVAGKYDSITLSVINRTDGVLDKQKIKFAEVIGKYNLGKGLDPVDPYMWEYNDEPEWYTKISNYQKNEIADKVMEYAEMFQDIGIKNANMFL